jgi:hypothetical protein
MDINRTYTLTLGTCALMDAVHATANYFLGHLLRNAQERTLLPTLLIAEATVTVANPTDDYR